MANKIKKNPAISDAVVLNATGQPDSTKLYAHIEWADKVDEVDKISCLKEIDEAVRKILPAGIEIAGFAEHDRIPYSPTTLKKDKNRLFGQKGGYFKIVNNERVEV